MIKAEIIQFSPPSKIDWLVHASDDNGRQISQRMTGSRADLYISYEHNPSNKPND